MFILYIVLLIVLDNILLIIRVIKILFKISLVRQRNFKRCFIFLDVTVLQLLLVVSFIVITKSIIFPFFEVISKCQNHSNYSYQSNRTMMNNLLYVIVLVNKDLYNDLYLRDRENPRVHSHVLSLSIILLVVTKLFNNNDC